MGEIKSFTAEKLVMGILIADVSHLPLVMESLNASWGAPDCVTEPVEFTFSDYYAPEMGSPLYRVFCSFERLVDPSELAAIKIKSNDVEDRLRNDTGRTVNLDPGLLCQSKFILASTKNNAHRIPLSQGIYAELTLQYRAGEFRELEWTYPDYRGEAAKRYLLDVRKIYVSQLKKI